MQYFDVELNSKQSYNVVIMYALSSLVTFQLIIC